MASTPDGGGYWLVASDGGIFAFGNATFHGSTGNITLNRPIVGMAPTPDGNGYWLVASDGGIFAFGNATFHGSAAGTLGTDRVAAGMQRSASGQGYTILAVAGGIRVGFAGDVHGVGRVGDVLAAGGNPLDAMRPILAANDVNVVNLETAVGSKGTAENKQYTFHSPPDLVRRLREAGVSVVNLANNHSLDFGPESLLETISYARDAGLLVVGAGANAAEAYAPAIVTAAAGTVAVLGISQVVPAGWAAGAGHPGVASAYDMTATTNAVRAARARADHVVVMIHAGVELAECPTDIQRQLAHALLSAGADAVVGGHPHVLQGIEGGGGRLIDYSMGDFVWYQNQPPSDQTGLLSVSLGPSGVEGYDFAPARVDDNGSPQPLTGQDASNARSKLDSLAPGAGRC
jgi:poly-gamma-glutamate synthesis protein (capsule biosynthesis protein)